MWMKNWIEFFRATAIVKWMAGRMSVGCAFGFFIYYFVFLYGGFLFLGKVVDILGCDGILIFEI